MELTVGVLALQGAFVEHIQLLQKASETITSRRGEQNEAHWRFLEVRNEAQLSVCDALIIPGGESTTISLVAERSGLLEPLREFVKVRRNPTWGTCAGLILLAESANRVKQGGQELIGGLDVRVNRNHFGRQIESFQTDLQLPFLDDQSAFPGVFIRAPVVERLLPHIEGVQAAEEAKEQTVVAPSREVADENAKRSLEDEVRIMAVLPGRANRLAQKGLEVSTENDAGDIIAVKQGNVFGTSFHPELTSDPRIHIWWLQQVQSAAAERRA